MDVRLLARKAVKRRALEERNGRPRAVAAPAGGRSKGAGARGRSASPARPGGARGSSAENSGAEDSEVEEMPALYSDSDSDSDGEDAERSQFRPQRHDPESPYFSFLTGCCGGNAKHAVFVDGVATIIPGLISDRENEQLCNGLCEYFAETRTVWAKKVYDQKMLVGDVERFGTTGVQGRLRTLLGDIGRRLDDLLGPLGYENQLWVEVIGMGAFIVLPDGVVAVGTQTHQDEGFCIKVILSVSPPDDVRGIRWSGIAAPQGGVNVLYPQNCAIIGTNEGFLKVEHGGLSGLVHESLPGTRPGFAIVYRFALPRRELVTVTKHPAVETLLSRYLSEPRLPLSQLEFSVSALKLEAVTKWVPALDGQLQASHIASALARGCALDTAGRLGALVSVALERSIPTLSAGDLVQVVHATRFGACLVPGCTFKDHVIALKHAGEGVLAIDGESLLRITGVTALYNTSNMEQLIGAAFAGHGAYNKRRRLLDLVGARLGSFSAAAGEDTPVLLWDAHAAARAAAGTWIDPPSSCQFCDFSFKPFEEDPSLGPHMGPKVIYEISPDVPGRMAWGCHCCIIAVRAKRLELTWGTSLTHKWARSNGKHTEAGKAAAVAMAAAKATAGEPQTCMVPGCGASLFGVKQLNRIFQHPKGALRDKNPRFIWCCNACYQKSYHKRLTLAWP